MNNSSRLMVEHHLIKSHRCAIVICNSDCAPRVRPRPRPRRQAGDQSHAKLLVSRDCEAPMLLLLLRAVM